jgi:hypothetical protein
MEKTMNSFLPLKREKTKRLKALHANRVGFNAPAITLNLGFQAEKLGTVLFSYTINFFLRALINCL